MRDHSATNEKSKACWTYRGLFVNVPNKSLPPTLKRLYEEIRPAVCKTRTRAKAPSGKDPRSQKEMRTEGSANKPSLLIGSDTARSAAVLHPHRSDCSSLKWKMVRRAIQQIKETAPKSRERDRNTGLSKTKYQIDWKKEWVDKKDVRCYV